MICKYNVYEDTKHCKTCNKCVARYDHHCMWLNNCIGGKNYSTFIRFIVSADICVLFKIIIEIFALIDTNQEINLLNLEGTSTNTRYILLIVLLAINAIFFMCLSELNRFHAYITYYGLSTI